MNQVQRIKGHMIVHGKQQTMEIPFGITALEAIRLSGIAFHAPCGGNGTCGKCKAKITGSISLMDQREEKFLSEDEKKKGIRLACMCKLLGDFEIVADAEELSVQTAAFCKEYTFLPMVSPDGAKSALGLAVDIGTTTVALYLCDLRTGDVIEKRGFRNPQSAYGADVISRIDKIMKQKEALFAQQRLISDAISKEVSHICETHGLSDRDILAMVVCGNTVMQHIAAGIDPSSIANAPFTAPTLFGEIYRAKTLGFLKHSDAPLYFAPCFASYVGGDIACGIIATGLDSVSETVLFIDIGTNGEIGLATKDGLYFCSAAAGPALEGAHIACGMPGLPGAVSEVFLENGQLRYRTIGNLPAVGICGSGIIDAVAWMLRMGLLDETGRIVDADEAEAYASYIEEDENGDSVFMIDKERNVYLCGRDIREIQLAKAAICAGIDTLLHEAGLETEDVKEVVIAGGFGSHLKAESICRIGLVPPMDAEKLRFVGNAAGAGATAILLGKEPRAAAKEIVSKSKYTELSKNAYFMEKYIEEMMFSE